MILNGNFQRGVPYNETHQRLNVDFSGFSKGAKAKKYWFCTNFVPILQRFLKNNVDNRRVDKPALRFFIVMKGTLFVFPSGLQGVHKKYRATLQQTKK